MKRHWMLALMILVCFGMAGNAFALMVTGNGYGVDSETEISSGVEFVGVSGYINFDFDQYDDHVLLTISNSGIFRGLSWHNYDVYTFSGFTDITDMYILSNNGFHGTILTDSSFTSNEISIDFDRGHFDLSCAYDQSIVFYIETVTSPPDVDIDPDIAPVPEPATMLLFGTGIVGCFAMIRRKK